MVAVSEEWTSLTWDELWEDLEEYAAEGPALTSPAKDLQSTMSKVHSGQVADCVAPADVDALLSAHRALDATSSDLQTAMGRIELSNIDVAATMASLMHGPLCPPGASTTVEGEELISWVMRTFAPEVAPKVPDTWPPALGELTSSADLNDYCQRLLELPSTIYVRRGLRLCIGELDKYQDTKDINRDSLLINGQALSGAHGGYDAAVASLVHGMHAASNGCKTRGPSEEALTGAAQLILGALNRTTSGFVAFEEVLRVFGCPELVVVQPHSSAAKPLEAVLFGGIVLGRAHTRYV
eukprot:2937506-Amphidinium_carterae.1